MDIVYNMQKTLDTACFESLGYPRIKIVIA